MASEAAAVRRPGLDPRKLTWLLVVVGLAALVAVLAVAARTGAIGRGNLVYDVLVEPFVLMVQAPDLLVQTLVGRARLGRALCAHRARLRAHLQGLRGVQLRAGDHGRVRGPDPRRPAREGRAGARRARARGRRDARARDRGRARGAAAARQPARHHPVHGDLRPDLLPHRPRRADLRRQPEADDREPALSAARSDRRRDLRRPRPLPAHRHRRGGDRLADDRDARRVLLEDPDRARACGRSPTATRRRSRSASR